MWKLSSCLNPSKIYRWHKKLVIRNIQRDNKEKKRCLVSVMVTGAESEIDKLTSNFILECYITSY